MNVGAWVGVGVGSALCGVALTLLIQWHRHWNHRVRKRVLGDSTHVWGCASALHTVHFLRLKAARHRRGRREDEREHGGGALDEWLRPHAAASYSRWYTAARPRRAHARWPT